MADGILCSVKFLSVLTILCAHIGLYYCGLDKTYRCPAHLRRSDHLRVHGNKCYNFVPDEVSWMYARDRCSRNGGALITIMSRDIQIFVERTLHDIWDKNGIWIGAHDRESEMDWHWVTGETMRSGFQNWDHGQPSCFLLDFLCHEDCACLRKDEGYKWHDYLCGSTMYRYGYACQYNLLPPMKTATTRTIAQRLTTALPTTALPTTVTPTKTPSTTPKPTKNDKTTVPVYNIMTTPEKTTTTTSAGVTSANISFMWTAPDNIVQVESQRLSKKASGMETGGMVGLVVSFVLVFIAGLVMGIFVCRRRYRKMYDESLTLGFNNVLYTAAPAHDAQTKVKDTNILTVTSAEDGATDDEADDRYVDIEDLAACGCVELPPPYKDINAPAEVACLKENLYDTVVTHEEATHVQEMGGACEDTPPLPCTGANVKQFSPEFLQKDTDQAYSNNLYGFYK